MMGIKREKQGVGTHTTLAFEQEEGCIHFMYSGGMCVSTPGPLPDLHQRQPDIRLLLPREFHVYFPLFPNTRCLPRHGSGKRGTLRGHRCPCVLTSDTVFATHTPDEGLFIRQASWCSNWQKKQLRWYGA